MRMMTTVEARDNFSDMINQAAYGQQRIVLTRRGKPLAAVISISELEKLQQQIQMLTNQLQG